MFPEPFRTLHTADYLLSVGGDGPAVLLHGFPETRLCWDAETLRSPRVPGGHFLPRGSSGPDRRFVAEVPG